MTQRVAGSGRRATNGPLLGEGPTLTSPLVPWPSVWFGAGRAFGGGVAITPVTRFDSPRQRGRIRLGDSAMHKPSDTMEVIGYLRVSTDEQARSGLGLEAQRATITRYADLMGWEVTWLCDEGWSGSDTRRPGLAEALGRLQRRDAQALVVAKLDRLSRSVHDFSGLLQTARSQKWAVVALDVSVDTTTLTGELVANILMSVSQWERGIIRQRTSDAVQAKLARGEDWGRRSQMDADVEALIASLRADGLSALRIARRLNTDAVPTVRGGGWHASTVARVLKRVERRAQRGSAA